LTHSYESFIAYFYKYNQFPDNSYINKEKKYNDKQLKTKYEKYLKSLEKRSDSVARYSANAKKRSYDKISQKEFAKGTNTDPEWVKVCSEVDIRDKSCVLIQTLNPDEYAELCDNSGGFHNQLTHAHVLPKGGRFVKFYYEKDNIYLLNLYSHGLLDSGKNPITGEAISKEEQLEWWDRILAPYNLSHEKLVKIYNDRYNNSNDITIII